MLNRISKDLRGRGVRVVGVSSDRAPPRKVAAWLGEKKVGYRAHYGDSEVQNGRSILGDVSTLPRLVLLSRRGRVLRRWNGAVPEKLLRAAMKPLPTPTKRE